MSDHAYGLWAGLAIDNTAEATAAGNLWSEQAGKIAVLAKTTRNATIGFVVLGLRDLLGDARARRRPSRTRPRSSGRSFRNSCSASSSSRWLATLGAFSKEQAADLANLSRWAFLLTFAGVGLSTDFREMRKPRALPVPGGRGGRDRHRDRDARHRDRGAALASGMSASIMPAAPIPNTAPFAEDEIEILNRVVGPATPVQRAWLAGFLAGLDAANAPQARACRSAAEGRAADRSLRDRVRQFRKARRRRRQGARKLGFKPSLVDMADLDIASLKDAKRLIVIAATWGEGEPPARAVRAYKELMSDAAPRLDGVEFGVLALGDTAYAEFCAIGKAIDERLAALGGKRVADRVDCDLDFAEPAAHVDRRRAEDACAAGGRARATVIAVDFGANRAAPNLGRRSRRRSPSTSISIRRAPTRRPIHLELAFDGAAPAYKPGDSLDLYAENDPAYVDALLKAAGVLRRRAARASSSRAATSPRCRSRRWRPMRRDRPALRQGAARRRRRRRAGSPGGS